MPSVVAIKEQSGLYWILRGCQNKLCDGNKSTIQKEYRENPCAEVESLACTLESNLHCTRRGIKMQLRRSAFWTNCLLYSHTKTLLQTLDKIVRLAPLEVFSCNPSLDLTFHWTHDKEEQSEY